MKISMINVTDLLKLVMLQVYCFIVQEIILVPNNLVEAFHYLVSYPNQCESLSVCLLDVLVEYTVSDQFLTWL